MDYKEKYEQALERAKEWSEGRYGHSVDDTPKDIAEYIFPELKESEESYDERIKKAIKYGLDYVFTNNTTIYETTKEQCLSWLEKQGEQKPAWSEEDEAMRKTTILYLENTKDSCAAACVPYIVKCINWLKSLKDRVLPQREWSEEDEGFRNLLIAIMKVEHPEGVFEANGITPFCGTVSVHRVIDWLKSLRPQKQWKPSEEQMLAINTAINVFGKGTVNGKYLIELQEQLKKLREE